MPGAAVLLMCATLVNAATPAATASAPVAAKPAATATPAAPPAWVQRSNASAMAILGTLAKFAPEEAGRFGVPGLDKEILDLKPGFEDRMRQAFQGSIAMLQAKLADEKDPSVRQDLAIMIETLRQHLEGDSLTRALMLPYFDVSGTVFLGLKSLLDDQVAADRRPAALDRL
jgi:hypothetical protein